MIILDTNVVAVLMGTSKHDVATAWLNRQDPHALFLTAITRAEVRYGIAPALRGVAATGSPGWPTIYSPARPIEH